MEQYKQLVKRVLDEGEERTDRTGVGTLSVFGHQTRYDLSKGFPILTTKRVPFRLIVSELLWFLKGDTNIRYLLEHNNHIWDEWAFENYIESSDYYGPDMTDFGLRVLEDEEFKRQYDKEMTKFQEKVLTDDEFAEKYGDLGSVYGKQWRSWEGKDGKVIDQIQNVINQLKENPTSRRLIVSAWNPAEVDEMALPPCHTLFQFYVSDNKLSCQLYQRSADVFLGVPFNIASYALLTHLIAEEVGLRVGEFIHTLGDAHLYSNHIEQANTLLEREPKTLPKLMLLSGRKIDEYEADDIKLIGYKSHPSIKAPIAV